MVIVRTWWLDKIKAGALMAYPFLFVGELTIVDRRTRLHEGEHGRQQLMMAVVIAVIGICLALVASWPPQPAMALVVTYWLFLGWAGGVLLWYFLYLLCLPTRWNLFRAWAERRAFRAEGRDDAEIDVILRGPPYYLTGFRS